MEDFLAEEEVKSLSEQQFNDLVLQLENFEFELFSLIAGQEQYEIIPLSPDNRSDLLAANHLKTLEKTLMKQGVRVLYKTPGHECEVIFNPHDFSRIIVIPEGDIEDISC